MVEEEIDRRLFIVVRDKEKRHFAHHAVLKHDTCLHVTVCPFQLFEALLVRKPIHPVRFIWRRSEHHTSIAIVLARCIKAEATGTKNGKLQHCASVQGTFLQAYPSTVVIRWRSSEHRTSVAIILASCTSRSKGE